jgi:hypothetical protein
MTFCYLGRLLLAVLPLWVSEGEQVKESVSKAQVFKTRHLPLGAGKMDLSVEG